MTLLIKVMIIIILFINNIYINIINFQPKFSNILRILLNNNKPEDENRLYLKRQNIINNKLKLINNQINIKLLNKTFIIIGIIQFYFHYLLLLLLFVFIYYYL